MSAVRLAIVALVLASASMSLASKVRGASDIPYCALVRTLQNRGMCMLRSKLIQLRETFEAAEMMSSMPLPLVESSVHCTFLQGESL